MNLRTFLIATLALGTLLLFAGTESSFAQPPSKVSQAVKDRLAREGRTRVIVQLEMASDSMRAGRPSTERQRA